MHFDTSSRARFFCQVYRTFARELRERYVWILTGNDYHRWNISMSNCSRAEVLEAARGHIVIDSAFESKISPINPLMVCLNSVERTTALQIDSSRRDNNYKNNFKAKIISIGKLCKPTTPSGWLLYSSEHPSNGSNYWTDNSSSEHLSLFDDDRIPIEQFTYNDMIMRDQWLTLLEEIHFHGVSVRRQAFLSVRC